MPSYYRLKQDFRYIPKDSIVEKYLGHTYGCINDNCLAVVYDTIFLGIPKILLEITYPDIPDENNKKRIQCIIN